MGEAPARLLMNPPSDIRECRSMSLSITCSNCDKTLKVKE